MVATIISIIIMCVLGAGVQDGGSVRDYIKKDIDMKSKYTDSSSNSVINSLFDLGGVPFLLWL